jgi:outer membrane receptor protein involved in Fe transport
MLSFAQLLLSALLIVDVGAGTYEFEDLSFCIAQDHGLLKMPAIGAVPGAQIAAFERETPPVTASSCSPGIGAVGACTIDAAGLNTVHTPTFTMNLSADYAKPTQIGAFDIAAIFYHNDGFYWDPANQVRQPTYSLYNASIGWLNPQERFGVRLWGKNLGGAKYYSYAITQSLGEDFSPAPPRTYGVTLSAHL